MRIRLGEADRERLGCPEWLVEDRERFTILEADLLQRAGVEPDDAIAEMFGQPIEGQPVTENGYAVRRVSMLGWRIRVWLALRRAGIEIPFTELDFDLFGLEKEADEPAADEGKGEEESVPSPTSASSTTP